MGPWKTLLLSLSASQKPSHEVGFCLPASGRLCCDVLTDGCNPLLVHLLCTEQKESADHHGCLLGRPDRCKSLHHPANLPSMWAPSIPTCRSSELLPLHVGPISRRRLGGVRRRLCRQLWDMCRAASGLVVWKRLQLTIEQLSTASLTSP